VAEINSRALDVIASTPPIAVKQIITLPSTPYFHPFLLVSDDFCRNRDATILRPARKNALAANNTPHAISPVQERTKISYRRCAPSHGAAAPATIPAQFGTRFRSWQMRVLAKDKTPRLRKKSGRFS